MKLDAARLCLDCDEIHVEQICPACSSEAFAFVTRWVKTSGEHRIEHRAATAVQAATPQARTPEQIEAYRQLIEGKPEKTSGRTLVTRSVVGLAAVSLLGWAWKVGGKGKSAVPGAGFQVPGRVPGSRGSVPGSRGSVPGSPPGGVPASKAEPERPHEPANP